MSRAILVVCSLQGANDIASNRPLRKWKKVDHHHIFPRAVLKEINKEPNLALNCMMLESFTNKEWAKKWPGDYLMEMIEASNPEEEVVKRLNTHLLNAKKLISIKASSEADLGSLYDEFLRKRASLVVERIDKLLTKGDKE